MSPEQIIEAIRKIFNDTSKPKEETYHELLSIQEELEIMLDSLGVD